MADPTGLLNWLADPEPEGPPPELDEFIGQQGVVLWYWNMFIIGRLCEFMGPEEEPRKTWESEDMALLTPAQQIAAGHAAMYG